MRLIASVGCMKIYWLFSSEQSAYEVGDGDLSADRDIPGLDWSWGC